MLTTWPDTHLTCFLASVHAHTQTHTHKKRNLTLQNEWLLCKPCQKGTMRLFQKSQLCYVSPFDSKARSNFSACSGITDVGNKHNRLLLFPPLLFQFCLHLLKTNLYKRCFFNGGHMELFSPYTITGNSQFSQSRGKVPIKLAPCTIYTVPNSHRVRRIEVTTLLHKNAPR